MRALIQVRARYHRMLTAALQDDAGTEAFSPQPWSGAQALAAIATG